MYKLGIDVGGTNIDFAVVDQHDRLLYSHKILAQGDLHRAIAKGLSELKQSKGFDLSCTEAIHLGTTLAINSLLELKSLHKVGLLRLASHAPDFPPAYLWPKTHRDSILVGHCTVAGGREYDNRSVKALNNLELINAANTLIDMGAESLAIVSVFSPLYAEDELSAANLIRNQISSTIPLSLSHQLGGLGFIERENSTLLNAALKKVLRESFKSLSFALKENGFKGECFITRNNGTLFSLAEAIEFPVMTIASGPSNSLIGASKLSQLNDAVIVDIGGTSTDIGIIENGFPLYSLKGAKVAGIPCQLLAPDIRALSMGGGSIIRSNNHSYSIGPDSLGAELFTKCKTTGGSYMTLYDVGQSLKAANNKEAEAIMIYFLQQIKTELISLIPDPDSRPILLVGGGSENIPDSFLASNFLRPPHYQIANAYGAALSEVAGQVDCIVQFQEDREKQIKLLEEKAIALAIEKGATAGSIRIIEKKILPLHYMQEPRSRVLITAAGRMRSR